LDEPIKVYIYETSPVKKVVGEFKTKITDFDYRNILIPEACISKDYQYRYFKNSYHDFGKA